MRMPRITTVFYWFGGVIADCIPRTVSQLLFAQPIEKIDIQIRLRLRDLTTDLCLNRISARDFCDVVIQESGVSFTSAELETAIMNSVSVRDEVLDVISTLPEGIENWLICDYPKDWYKAITRDGRFADYFPANRILFTETSHLPRLVPDLFYYLTQSSGIAANHCIMIDQNSARAVLAVKHRFHSAIFVDVTRLRREFVLRRMLPPPPGFVFPGPVDI